MQVSARRTVLATKKNFLPKNFQTQIFTTNPAWSRQTRYHWHASHRPPPAAIGSVRKWPLLQAEFSAKVASENLLLVENFSFFCFVVVVALFARVAARAPPRDSMRELTLVRTRQSYACMRAGREIKWRRRLLFPIFFLEPPLVNDTHYAAKAEMTVALPASH